MKRSMTMGMSLVLLAGCALDTLNTSPREGFFIDEVAAPGSRPISDGKTAGVTIDRREFDLFGTVGEMTLRSPVFKGTAVEREVQKLGECIAQAWPGDRASIKYVIKSGQSPSAEALPNQISVNVGLLTEDNLQSGVLHFVLAHEMSHILLRHYEREEFRGVQKKALELASGGVIAATVIAETQFGDERQSAGDRGDHIMRVVGFTMLAYSAAYFAGEGVVESAWGRQQEYDADLLGVDLMMRSGRPPESAFAAFDMLKREAVTRKSATEQYSEMAMARFRTYLAKSGMDHVVDAVAAVAAEAATAFFLDVWNELNATHPSLEQRERAVDDYLSSVNERIPPKGISCDGAGLETAMKGRVFRTTVAALQELQRIPHYLENSDIGAARKAYAGALRGVLKHDPVVRYYAYLTEKQAGNDREALEQLRKIRFDADTPILAFTALITEYIGLKRTNDARNVIALGKAHFPPDYFYPFELQLAAQANNNADVLRMRALCRETAFTKVEEACENVERNGGYTNRWGILPNGPAALEDLF